MADEQEVLSELILTANAEHAGRRLDVFVASQLPGVSRAKVQRLIAAGAVMVNGRSCAGKDQVAAGDVVTVARPPDDEARRLAPVAMELSILFEDEHVIVLNKPVSLSVHPGAGDSGPTLVHGLLHHCKTLPKPLIRPTAAAADKLAVERPGIVHRLDKDTSGVMVCAKTDVALAALGKQFHDKTNDREYVALLDGAMDDESMDVESWIHRDPRLRTRMAATPLSEEQPTGARKARSLFTRERAFKDRVTLARIRLFTGRTHQIRVHAAAIKTPILGDQLYHPGTPLPRSLGPEVVHAVASLTRQMLHARLLGFTHPATGERLVFEAPPPADFRRLLGLLEQSEING